MLNNLYSYVAHVDDEDPDSNDERYDGNDYPEDEDEDGDDAEEAQYRARMLAQERLEREKSYRRKHGIVDGEQGLKSKIPPQAYSQQWGQGQAQDFPPVLAPEEEDDVGEDILEEILEEEVGAFEDLDGMREGMEVEDKYNNQIPKFERDHSRHTGRVLRPQHVTFGYSDGEGGLYPEEMSTDIHSSGVYSNNGFGGLNKTPQALQQLWGEEGYHADSTRDEELDPESRERLKHMADRSGMQFGSNRNEFDMNTGLPKYGVELSDVDEDMYIQDDKLNITTGKYNSNRKGYNEFAYDSADNSD